MLTTTGGSPRPATTLAGAWAKMGPPLLPRPFTNVTANHVTSFLGLSRVLVETGDLRGERHSKTYPALPQGRNWQVPQSSEDKRPVAGREDGHSTGPLPLWGPRRRGGVGRGHPGRRGCAAGRPQSHSGAAPCDTPLTTPSRRGGAGVTGTLLAECGEGWQS